MKIRNPKATIIVFKNGNIVCLGTNNEIDAKIACKKAAKILKQNFGYEIRFSSFKPVNLVGNGHSGFSVYLQKMNLLASPSEMHFEPEVFSGLIWKVKLSTLSFTTMIFGTGQFLIVGVKSQEEMSQAGELVLNKMKKFQRPEIAEEFGLESTQG